jgi:hypothetical protein
MVAGRTAMPTMIATCLTGEYSPKLVIHKSEVFMPSAKWAGGNNIETHKDMKKAI